ncbi:MAG: hypothetical protein CMM97_01030 [Rickettsiales bacterium]|nr:hypothetical protein [Rickettsiales bacterium]
MPKAIANSKLPLLVSIAMVVVITRVTCSILPPTIITAPTSAIARPRPAKIAVSNPWRASQMISKKDSLKDRQSDRNCNSYLTQRSETICRVRAAIMGVMRID